MLAVPRQPSPIALQPPPVVRPWIAPSKRQRRTATGVCAGWFEERPIYPGRDALTSLLNGVTTVNWQQAVRKEHERRGIVLPKGQFSTLSGDIAGIGGGKHKKEAGGRRRPGAIKSLSSFSLSLLDDEVDYDDEEADDDEHPRPWAATLPPTPDRSVTSGTTSRTSSKPPNTPFDVDATSPQTSVSPSFPGSAHPFSIASNRRHTHGDIEAYPHSSKTAGKIRRRTLSTAADGVERHAKRVKLERSDTTVSAPVTSQPRLNTIIIPGGMMDMSENPNYAPRPRQRGRKHSTAKKGWKGWIEVEDSEAEPESLIKLDAPPELKERRTRSGKNFDAIGVGDGSWV